LFVSIDHILEKGGQFVLLGTGEKKWEEKFTKLASTKKYKGNIAIKIEFSVDLANEIYCGSDFFFVPSLYEPCGLTQMISMHYGTPPIVRNVGGLKDTVRDNETGFTFDEYSSLDLNKAISRAFKLYEDKEGFGKMIENTLAQDFSWDVSAKKYVDLYQYVIDSRK